MKENKSFFIVAGLIVLLLAGMAVLTYLSKRIPSNEITVTGNTAGNLNNKGLFCESEGKVYFSNAYDNGSLYSMNVDETEMKKLVSGTASSINAGGDFLYYFMDNARGGTGFGYMIRSYGIYRAKKNGKDPACLVRDACITMQLAGDYLYYQRYNNKDYTQFYKIKTDKSEDVHVAGQIINPASCENGIIYFNGQDKDHNLYTLDTRSDTITQMLAGNFWFPVYKDGYVYYLDLAENYRLCRYRIDADSIEILTHDRIENYNIAGSYIYYQVTDREHPALKRMRLDGSGAEIVAEGNFCNINATSYYVYFQEYGAETPVYKTPAEGSIQVTNFDAARDAAFANAE